MSPAKLNSILTAIDWLVLTLNTLCILFALASIRVLLKRFSAGGIHRNLRIVLAGQSAAIICSTLFTAGDTILHFAMQNPLYTDPWLAAGAAFSNQFVVLIGYCLLLERVLATVMARYYEHWASLKFSLGWATILALICLYGGYSTYQTLSGNGNLMQSDLQTTLFINFVLLVISLAEIFILWKLGLYNASKYSLNEFYSRQKPTLTERYQLSENVRTIRQLGPVFVGHFLECLVITSTVGLQAYFSNAFNAASMLVIFPLCACSLALCNLGILGAVILFHPAQRRRVVRLIRHLFRRLFWCHVNRVEDVSPTAKKVTVVTVNRNFPKKETQGKIDSVAEEGKKTKVDQFNTAAGVVSQESDLHFRMLTHQWR